MRNVVHRRVLSKHDFCLLQQDHSSRLPQDISPPLLDGAMSLIVNQRLDARAVTCHISLALVENIVVVVAKMATVEDAITVLVAQIVLGLLYRPVLQGKRAAPD